MRRSFVLPFLFLPVLAFAQTGNAPADSTNIPYSGNGWYLSPHGTIRILVIYAEIDYDVHPSHDPQPNGAEHWPKGQLPKWKDNLFDPFPSAAPKAMLTRYYRDISMGNFTVLGDYIDHVVTVHESEQANMRNWSGMVWDAANKDGALHTAHHLSIADFDMWRDGGRPGLPKINTPDDPHSYDHVMVVLRNSSGLRNGQGSTDAGSSGLLFGHPSDTQSRFGAMSGLPFEILHHEFNHLLLGGNNFHSGGGNAPQFDSYLLCDQGGWSMMGAANSSLLTCNAWDRDRMGWKAADAPFRINAHNAEGHYVNGDLNPWAGDTGLYVLHDFVPSGDALRIRMPFIPDGHYRQWLWIGNHQTTARNGSATDRFHWEYTGAPCLSKAEPGLFMFIQVEREEKRGRSIYGGSADYIHALTASGHYDVIVTDDTIRPSCPFNGEAIAYRLKKRFANPLTGNSEQELVVYDRNKDGTVQRGEHLVLGPGYRPDGSLANDAAFFGAARDAWRINGNRVLGISTNPSSANILTLRCTGRREINHAKAPDNRAVYLNGLRVELREQRANGDIVVHVGTGDTRLSGNVRWCADSIVLPPLRGKDDASLTVSRGARLLLDRSRTPTRMASQGTVKGTDYFAPSTQFTISANTRMNVEPHGRLDLEHGSVMHLMPGADLVLERKAKLRIDRSCKIIVHGSAQVELPARKLRKYQRKGLIVHMDG